MVLIALCVSSLYSQVNQEATLYLWNGNVIGVIIWEKGENYFILEEINASEKGVKFKVSTDIISKLVDSNGTILFENLYLEDEPRQHSMIYEFGRKKGINLQFLGPTVFSLYLQSAINSHNLNWNFGIGIIGDIQLGLNYHFLKDRAQSGGSPYIGVQVSRINQIKISGPIRSEVNTISIYIPIGLEFIKHNGFTSAIEVGPNFPGEDFSQINTAPILFALRIGKHFNRK